MIRGAWLPWIVLAWGCASEGAVEPAVSGAGGTAGQSSTAVAGSYPSGAGTPLAGATQGGSSAASNETGSAGLSHDWGRLPFVGSGGADAGGNGGNGGAASTAGSPATPGPTAPANCNTLCDCIIDVCGNVLRIFEHGHCVPGCDGLSQAQIDCRFAECLRGGSEAGAALRCEHAVGSGAEVPAACQ